MPICNLKEARETARAINEAKEISARAGDREAVDECYSLIFEEIRKTNRQALDFREIWDGMVEDGASYLRSRRGRRGGIGGLQESAQAVDTSAFRNIVGQIAFAETLDVYESPVFIGKQLCSTVKATTKFQELIPGVTKLGNPAQKVGEGQPYPRVGVGQEWVTAPEAVKHGFIIEFTEELLQEDKTNLLLERARGAAESMMINMEMEILNTVLGATTSYSRNGSAAIATYDDTHSGGPAFDNLAASNGLSSFSNVETALALLDAITDPNTGLPINLAGNVQLVVPRALSQTALNLLTARGADLGFYPTSGATNAVAQINNPITNSSRNVTVQGPISNAFVKAVTSSDTTWFIGDFAKAFRYREYWPIQVDQITPQEMAFNEDVITAFKVRRLGGMVVVDPRYVAKCTA